MLYAAPVVSAFTSWVEVGLKLSPLLLQAASMHY